MTDNIRYQIFISSTYKDLAPYRQKIIMNLLSVDAIPVGMEMFPSSDEDAWTTIKKTVEKSDYFILVLRGRYGTLDVKGG